MSAAYRRTRVGSLCSGYGGLEMGLALALGDVEVAWHVEYDKHPSAILAHRYPGVPNYGDVKHTDWTQVEPVDWLTAGYPCQPFSLAGLRKGADDPRHLWPGVASAIGALRPRGVLLENVAAHLRDGFDVVLGDLAALGYDARWGVVRASDAGAPHGRARLFIVAELQDAHGAARGQRGLSAPGQAQGGWARADAGRRGGASAPDTDGAGSQGRRAAWDLLVRGGAAARATGGGVTDAAVVVEWGSYAPAVRRWERITGRAAPRPTEMGRTGERLSPRFVEWLMGLPAGWVTDVPGLPRNAQLKALGNGVVPQQAALACRLLGVTAEAVAA